MAKEPPGLDSGGEHPTQYGEARGPVHFVHTVHEHPAQPGEKHVLDSGGEHDTRVDPFSRFLEEGRELPPELEREHRAVLLRPGQLVAKRFEVVEMLGFGGMGAVYKVKDRALGTDCALKVMLPSLLGSETARQRFYSEIRISQEMAHDGIVRVHTLLRDEERGLEFFVMEFVEGKTLHRLLNERGGRLPVREALEIILEVCDALEYAHRRTIHRDLKPQNIMVQPDGRIKILDFGLAKLMSPGRLTKSSMALGTAYYQAPEQSVYLRELDQRADIYSLGVVFYQLLTGKIPLGRVKPPSTIASGVPRALDGIVLRCLESESEDRYPDVAALRTAIVEAARPRRRKWPLAVVGLAAVACVFGAVFGMRVIRENVAQPPPAGEHAPDEFVVPPSGGPEPTTPVPETSAPDRLKPELQTPPPPSSPAVAQPPSAGQVPGIAQPGAAVPEAGQTRSVDLGGGVMLELVWIPPGTFTMGSPSSEKERFDGERQHQVTLTKGFWLGKYEVTQEQWERVMGSNPSNFKGAKNPVEQVSWDDTQAFCQKAGNGLRLPTEVEWEYACRAGSTTAYCFGDSESGLGDYAWYDSNSGSSMHPVGQKRANAWGLYDMHGNVWEWCQDWCGDYPSGSVTDPTGSASGSGRVLRGGAWGSKPRFCRSAGRDWYSPAFRGNGLGFRLAAPAVQ